MDDMIERVAVAICWSAETRVRGTHGQYAGCNCSGPEMCTARNYKEDLNDARAAIEAMRVPTPSMKALDESLAHFLDNSTIPPLLTTPLGAHTGASWEQMIECALGGKE